MPELPEAETVRRGLQAEVAGRRILRVEVTGRRSVRRHPDPGELHGRLAGGTVTSVGRIGKFLTIGAGVAPGPEGGAVDPGDPGHPGEVGEVLVVHLGMSGQLLWASGDPVGPRPRHSHVVIAFDDGTELRFVDPRTFGQVFLSEGRGGGGRPVELAHLGFDPLADRITASRFSSLLRARRTMLKARLMDQAFVAGLGNIYSDEVLHAAGLRFDRPASSLNDHQARSVLAHMRRILRASVSSGGSSLSDMQYRDVYGRPGRYQERHRVFARENQPCRTCRGPITRQAWGGRSTFFCPSCQT